MTNSTPLRILVVDDDPVTRMMVRHLLVGAGHQVDEACDGRDALRQISAQRFQIVISDWDMPEMDGAELCRQIRHFDSSGYSAVDEKYDGSGYPQGLAGDEIPLAARIVAVADVYDALRSRRVYKPAFTHEKSVQIIRTDCGTHFDPDIVTAFLQIHPQFEAIADRFAE